MKHTKVQSLRSLREEMKAVARGEKPAAADASKPSFNSVEAAERPAPITSQKHSSGRSIAAARARGRL